MHPTFDNAIAALQSTRRHPQIETLDRHRAKIRSTLFVVACSAMLATGVFVAGHASTVVHNSKEPKLGSARNTAVSRKRWQTESKDISQQPTVFDQIPQVSRQEFVKRLDMLLDYRRAERWDALFELVSNKDIRGRSRERFVEDYIKHPGVAGTTRKLINFSPKEVTPDSFVAGGWIISGCAQLSKLTFPVDAHVLASRENSEWRFSDIGMLVPRDTSFKPCGYLSQSAENLVKGNPKNLPEAKPAGANQPEMGHVSQRYRPTSVATTRGTNQEVISLCDLMDNKARYSGQVVRTEAMLVSTEVSLVDAGETYLYHPSCNEEDRLVVLDYEDSVAASAEVQAILKQALSKGTKGPVARARVTLVGTFDSSSAHGYGHLGGFPASFRVINIERVEAVSRNVPWPKDP